MTTETLVFPNGVTPLDLLLYRRFRREVPGLVEATLDRNPGLAALGPYPPRGTTILVEAPRPAPATPTRRIIRLYE